MKPHLGIPTSRRRRQVTLRSLMGWVVACAILAWIAADPVMRGVALMAVAAVALPVAILLGLMVLGGLGFAASALWARVFRRPRSRAGPPGDRPRD